MKTVYGIQNIETGDIIFVWDTTQKGSQRMTYHRRLAREGDDAPVHQLMKDVENFRIIILEEIDTKDNIDHRTAHYIALYKPIANKPKPKKLAVICHCGQVIQGEAALKRHQQAGPHWKVMEEDPVWSLRTLFA